MTAKDGFFLVVSRLLPYKNLDRVFVYFASAPTSKWLSSGPGLWRRACDTWPHPTSTSEQRQ